MTQTNHSRFFSVLAAAFGALAIVMALCLVPAGVTALAIVAFATTAVGLIRGEGGAALVGAALSATAMAGPTFLAGVFAMAAFTVVMSRARVAVR